MASETQCSTNEVLVAPTPTNEAPQMAATDTSAATSNLPPIEAEGIKNLTKHHMYGVTLSY